MLISKKTLCLLPLLLLVMATKCPKEPDEATLAKIQFDFSAIDENGLYRGESAVEYEFCIPAGDVSYEEILLIEPRLRVMQKSKGRIGCRLGQWLCIVSTHRPDWKEVLYAIAAKPYVERIIQTHYE